MAEEKSDQCGGYDPDDPNDPYNQMIATMGEEGFANQWAILDVTNWLHAQPDHEVAGHVGGASDHRTRTLTLWWHRPESDTAIALLEQVREQCRQRDVALRITPVPWDKATIDEATAVIFGPYGRTVLGFTPTGGQGPHPPTNVLRITGDLPDATPEEMAALAERARTTLRLPVPVVVRHQPPPKGPWG